MAMSDPTDMSSRACLLTRLVVLGGVALFLQGCGSNPDAAACAPTSKKCCPQSLLEEKTAKCSAVLKADGTVDDQLIRVAGEDFPKQMQGVFWLTGQGASSSLMSFAQSNDGCGLSTGTLANSTDSYKVRVNGDRTWFFSDAAGGWKLIKFLDLVYIFQITHGTVHNPKSFQIVPQGLNLAGLRVDATWLMDFDMNLLVDDHDGFNYTREEWSGSAVWGRPSSIAGHHVKSKNYLLVQVADGKGKPIQPAFDKWVAFCNSDETGSTPGELHYHEVDVNHNTAEDLKHAEDLAKLGGEAQKCCSDKKDASCLQKVVTEVDVVSSPAKKAKDSSNGSSPAHKATDSSNNTSTVRKLTDTLTLECNKDDELSRLYMKDAIVAVQPVTASGAFLLVAMVGIGFFLASCSGRRSAASVYSAMQGSQDEDEA